MIFPRKIRKKFGLLNNFFGNLVKNFNFFNIQFSARRKRDQKIREPSKFLRENKVEGNNRRLHARMKRSLMTWINSSGRISSTIRNLQKGAFCRQNTAFGVKFEQNTKKKKKKKVQNIYKTV